MSLFLVFFFLYFVPTVIANSIIINMIIKDHERYEGDDSVYIIQFIPIINIIGIVCGLYTKYQESQKEKQQQLVNEILSQIKRQEKSND